MVPIPPLLNLLLLLATTAAAVVHARRLRRRHPALHLDDALALAPALYLTLPLILLPVASALTFSGHEQWLWALPLWLQYWLSALHWGIALFAFTYLGVFASAVGQLTRHPERHKLPVVLVGLVACVQYAQHWYTQPIAPRLRHAVSADGVILQTSGKSCCAASGANIVRLMGGQATEKQMAELFGTSDGTSPAQVIYGMRELGIECRPLSLERTDPTALRAPAMLFVDHPATGHASHATVFAAWRDGRAEVWDPLSGKRYFDADQLAALWHGHGLECRHL